MNSQRLARSALLGLLLSSCTALGGSEDLRGGGESTFEVVAASPADGAPTVPLGATIVLTFNTLIDQSSVTSSTVGVSPNTFGTVTVDGSTLTFDPAGDLLPATTYVFAISPELTGTNGRALGVMTDPYGFKTGGTTQDSLPTQGPRPR